MPGDVVLLAAGDVVAADARLPEAAALEAAEAALTGDSMPVGKHPGPLPQGTDLADRRKMIYSGTHIAAERGVALVVATGLQTEVDKIATLTSAAVEPPTPLSQRITEFGRYLVGAPTTLEARKTCHQSPSCCLPCARDMPRRSWTLTPCSVDPGSTTLTPCSRDQGL